MAMNALRLPHDVASMVIEFHDTNACFNIPKHAGHISTASYDLSVAEESAARKIPRMGAEFSGTANTTAAFRSSQIVY